ncbi:MAG: hypothetical protein IJ317_00260, partial [Clostridia bacterium]|nr:hypothetical protein [Clostridia bacterium]
ENKAAKRLADASAYAETAQRETEAEVKAKTESIFEKRAADARLESSKILLSEKRKTVDSVYELALLRLVALDKEDCLQLAAMLLEKYAEKDDEVFFAENFKYAKEVSALPIVKSRGLKISDARLPLDGGMRLVGKVSDKDLSYGALLAADKDANQADLAKKLFK